MQRNIDALRSGEYDVLVIGAGIYGACCAREAARIGLRVALIDRGDFGSETSHNSLKTIHGGIRYIQQLDLVRMRESVKERRFWLTTAPHLVRPLRCVMPAYGHSTRGPEALWVAARVNDLIGYDRNASVEVSNQIGKSRILSVDQVKSLIPFVDLKNLTGGLSWYDGQVLDADRVTLECVMSANAREAVVANHVEAEKLLTVHGRIVGAAVRDMLTEDEFEIRAKLVINACGPWVSKFLSRALGGKPIPLDLPLNLNMNVVTRQLVKGHAVGTYSRRRSSSTVDSSRRLFFVAPWRDRSIIGTTHEPYIGDPDSAEISEPNLNKFVDEINDAIPSAKLTADDICYCYWGLTPAYGDKNSGNVARPTRSLVVDHGVTDGVQGLLSVVGIKYTTARAVAEKAVQKAARYLGSQMRETKKTTEKLPGAKTSSRVDLDNSDDDGEEPTTKSLLRKQSLFSVRHEMAMRLEDVVLRRTDYAERGHLDQEMLNACGRLLQEAHSWSQERLTSEISRTEAKLKRAHCRIANSIQ